MKSTTNDTAVEENVICSILSGVCDPEVPVLTIVDLGIVRSVHVLIPQHAVVVKITPTYSGCPAMDVIRINIRMALLSHGYSEVQIQEVLSPAWTTAWMSDKGKEKLKAYGIAPPGRSMSTTDLFTTGQEVACPLCGSNHTRLLSEFGSTSCKALYQCNECKEPFDLFKCH